MRNWCWWPSFILSSLVLVVISTKSKAQTSDIQNYHPTTTSTGLATVKGGRTLGILKLFTGVSAVYARNPLVLTDNGTGQTTPVVDDRLDFVITTAVGVWQDIDLSLVIPIIGHQRSSAKWVEGGYVAQVKNYSGISDPGFQCRIGLLKSAKHLVDLAFVPQISYSFEAKSNFTTSGGLLIVPEFVASRKLGRLLIAANLGYRWKVIKDNTGPGVGSQILAKAGVGYQLDLFQPEDTLVTIEFFGVTKAKKPWQKKLNSPTEGLISAKYRLNKITISLGIGMGLIAGYGSPLARTILGLSWDPFYQSTPETIAPAIEPVLKLSSAADQDGDGVADVDDACPTEPEDKDNLKDEDGCPEVDVDNDTILDDQDKCPKIAEDLDGFEDENGCPDADNDKDGFLDPIDECPSVAEDVDGYEDNDGCVDIDNDDDGIFDVDDKCPYNAEVINNFEDEDGCPDEVSKNVTLSAKGIEVNKAVFFLPSSHKLLPRAERVLNQVAEMIIAHPEISVLRIEGHTDPSGSKKFNKKLSKRRARTVRKYLIKKDVEAKRLKAVGYGESRLPVAKNVRRSRILNRRVQMVILKRQETPKELTPKTMGYAARVLLYEENNKSNSNNNK